MVCPLQLRFCWPEVSHFADFGVVKLWVERKLSKNYQKSIIICIVLKRKPCVSKLKLWYEKVLKPVRYYTIVQEHCLFTPFTMYMHEYNHSSLTWHTELVSETNYCWIHQKQIKFNMRHPVKILYNFRFPLLKKSMNLKLLFCLWKNCPFQKA